MEIKATYKQNHKEAILDKQDYKQRHFLDFSVITTDIDFNEEYAKHMITDFYSQYEKKPGAQPPWQHRFLLFMVQHHSTKITKIMQDAGLSAAQINQLYDYFDENAPRHFSRPNMRNLTEIQQQQQLS
eukprot:6490294-Amphidinium_carterae.7